MSKLLQLFAVILLTLGSLNATAADVEYQAGFHYLNVPNPQPVAEPGKVEVIEMFWYGCPHCYRFEPELEEWLKNKPANVNFIRIPAVLRDEWGVHAQAYYTAEALGILDKIHKPLFDAIHKERRHLDSEKALQAFFVEHGVSADEFTRTFNSFAVMAKVKRAKDLGERFDIHGVPTMIVQGKYTTDAKYASLDDPRGPRHENVLKVVNYLIAREAALLPRK